MIDPATTVGPVRLTVSDVDRSRSFYEQVIGLAAGERTGDVLVMGTPGGGGVIELKGDHSASPLDHRATGLFHLAILLPSRPDLARSLRRLADAGWRLSGASDHLVSEALYLSDPDGNGIEIYRDRPREEWRERDGQIEMATIPLDLRGLMAEAPDEPAPATVPAQTHIGHVHLQVAELEETERFYTGVLGFDVTVRGYPGALFFSAGGYHHHIGANTWNSAGSSPPLPGSVGLRNFEVRLPDTGALQQTLAEVEGAGIQPERLNGGVLVRDPSGNGVLLTTA